MGIKILIIIACIPLYVVNSFCDKIVSAKSGNKYNVLYNCIKFFLCSLCTVPMLFWERTGAAGLGSLICGVLCGVLYAVSKTVMLKGYAASSVAFMTLCHSSGMIVPCILGHFLWSEPLGILSLTGILLTVVSILLLKETKGSQQKFRSVGLLFGLIIFLTSGGVMICQKVMGIYFKGEGVGAYTLYSFLIPTLILAVLSKPAQIKELSSRREKSVGVCALGSAVSLSVISLVMTRLSSDVPSVILFPLFNGLGIIAVCISSVFAFKEKMNFRKSIGLGLGILGLYIINLS